MIKRLQLYAESLKPLLTFLKDNPDDKDIKYAVSRITRISLDNPKETGMPFMFSVGALKAATDLGIENPEETLKWVRWKKQTHKSGLRDESRKNGIFHQEHIVPISQITKLLYELNDVTVENIHNILRDNFKIAWILKEEQKILDSVNRSGMRTPELLNRLQIYIKGFNC